MQDLKKVLAFWFPDSKYQDFWFSNQKDLEIKTQFYEMWDTLKNMSIDQLKILVGCDKDSLLAIIICLDQFTRNILRDHDRSSFKNTDDLSIKLLENLDEIINQFPVNRRIFLLLPFRHQRTTVMLDRCMQFIQVMEKESKSTSQQENIIRRFKTATLQDYAKVTDTLRFLDEKIDTENHIYGNDKELLEDIFDTQCSKYSGKFFKHQQFVSTNQIYIETLKCIKKYQIKSPIISLSGGVDSMALFYVLNNLLIDRKISKFVAVHLDYGNRPESKDEAKFLQNWCQYFQIPFVTRRIEHLKRKYTHDRVFYESETKKIRFALYRETIHRYECDAVMLGHHKDDLVENVLMNITKAGDILDLFTMKDHHVIDMIPISRPMLGVSKSVIYELAHKIEIPYFKDTTPIDSMRGKLRHIVIPALEEIVPSVRQNIFEVGKSSQEWKAVVDHQIIEPIVPTKRAYGFTIQWETQYKDLGNSCWQRILSKMFHSQNIRMISNKNLINLIDWFQTYDRKSEHSNKIVKLSNDHVAFFDRTPFRRLLVFLRSDMINKHKIPENFLVQNDKINTITLGNWDVCVTINTTENVRDRINSIDILDGKFEYFYRSCEHCRYQTGSDKRDVPTGSDKLDVPTGSDKLDVPTGSLGQISYGAGHKKSISRALFKHLAISKYIPKISFGVACFECLKQNKYIVYKISYKYNI
ncbi:MAG: putative tRNA(Ile)lysidine synthase [Dasosvirus sp.]|uniref:tRNA(Ile)-lysidine synthetase n=1 Tax=Dasosvirus sp. TaxID=2487764 RepID=A0A3G4ZRL3_9VIRU|nr:MAG: putative tRNA(Ile)lysidine synthase [Dasosvirus sp.]